MRTTAVYGPALIGTRCARVEKAMTDPVDTDALRAWAVDARDIATGGGSGPNLLNVCADKLTAAADEVDRLRAVIENAPHDVECNEGNVWRDGSFMTCTCWKAEAL